VSDVSSGSLVSLHELVWLILVERSGLGISSISEAVSVPDRKDLPIVNNRSDGLSS